MMREETTQEVENEYYKSYHIDLKNVDEIDYNKNEINKMLMIFKECNLEKLRGDEIMDEALDELERISSDEKIIGLYDKEKVEKKILNTRLRYAEETGEKRGEKIGLEKGKKDIARKMLKGNMPIEDIIKFTGLTFEELQKLK
jgi:predicted transposase/invertase (TIGR01784 family)